MQMECIVGRLNPDNLSREILLTLRNNLFSDLRGQSPRQVPLRQRAKLQSGKKENYNNTKDTSGKAHSMVQAPTSTRI